MDDAREPVLATLRARVEAASLIGLAEAVDAFLGDDPARIARVLAAWEANDDGELPRLTSGCWTALAPVGAARPPGEAPLVLEGLLAGAAVGQQAVADALHECRDRAARIPLAPALPATGGGDLLTELWRRALIAAVADYWALVTESVKRARPAIVAGDHAETTRLLRAEQLQMVQAAERVEVLAARVADIEQLEEAEQERGIAEPALAQAPRGDPVPAQALARRSKREIFHRWAPVLFLALSTWLALGVLYLILTRT
jgi:hypothetical protein